MAGQSIRCSDPALAEEEFNEALCCIDNFGLPFDGWESRAQAQRRLELSRSVTTAEPQADVPSVSLHSLIEKAIIAA
jgi:hypothetical protein